MIAMQDLLGQPADGYTLFVSVNALVTEIPHVIKLRFDPFKDIKPVAELGNDAGNGATPEELAKWLKRDHDKQGATLRALGINPQELGG